MSLLFRSLSPLAARVGLLAVGLAWATGCARVPENPPPRCEGLVCTVEEGAHLRTVVDATDDEAWVYFDFSTAGGVDVVDPEGVQNWDLGLRRFVVKSNGGVSGPGGVEVAVLEDTSFEELNQAPPDGYISDVEGTGDEREPGGTAFNEGEPWYDYSLLTHTVSAKPDNVYVVRTVLGEYFKMRFDAYYDADGAAGWPSFSWAAVAAPGL